MPKITAIVHARNDGLRLGRTLESLRACDEVLLVDHGSDDDTHSVARQYGARLVEAVLGVSRGTYVVDSNNDWILLLHPNEAVAEALEASLFEFVSRDSDSGVLPSAFTIAIREEQGAGWKDLAPETRLIDRTRINWSDAMPPLPADAKPLDGFLLRFQDPK